MKARAKDRRRTILLFGAAVLVGVLLAYLLVVLYFFPTLPEPEVPPSEAPAAAAPGAPGGSGS